VLPQRLSHNGAKIRELRETGDVAHNGVATRIGPEAVFVLRVASGGQACIAIVAVVIAWCAILFTGRYPRGLFDYVVGVQRWFLRVQAYALLLTTDRYPPCSLSD
jgi:hypothetical protein